MRAIVAGGAVLSYHLGKALISKGYSVSVINPGERDCAWLAERLKGVVVRGDASDPAILDDAGAGRVDLLLALTASDADNLVMCQLAQRRFGVPRVIALANDPANAELFPRLGISDVISLTQSISLMVERQVGFDEVLSQLPLAGGQVVATEVRLTASSPCVGLPVHQIDLPSRSLIGSVVRGSKAIIPRGPFRLEVGDRVLLLASPDDLGPALRALTGETP
jgi:trk system potassium uptake protein TrkA